MIGTRDPPEYRPCDVCDVPVVADELKAVRVKGREYLTCKTCWRSLGNVEVGEI